MRSLDTLDQISEFMSRKVVEVQKDIDDLKSSISKKQKTMTDVLINSVIDSFKVLLTPKYNHTIQKFNNGAIIKNYFEIDNITISIEIDDKPEDDKKISDKTHLLTVIFENNNPNRLKVYVFFKSDFHADLLANLQIPKLNEDKIYMNSLTWGVAIETINYLKSLDYINNALDEANINAEYFLYDQILNEKKVKALNAQTIIDRFVEGLGVKEIKNDEFNYQKIWTISNYSLYQKY